MVKAYEDGQWFLATVVGYVYDDRSGGCDAYDVRRQSDGRIFYRIPALHIAEVR
jgi:hypothetical protein